MKKKLSFEQGMIELEELVHVLESGETSLEDSFKAYERAAELKKTLEELLDQGDKRIRMLTQNGEEEMDAEDLQ